MGIKAPSQQITKEIIVAKERQSAAFKAFLGGAAGVAGIQERNAREEQAKKAREQADNLAKLQRDAVMRNLKMQIDATNKSHQESLAQTKALHEAGLVHDTAMRTQQITLELDKFNKTMAATKAANLMNYNASQMRENMSYFEQYGVAPPSKWNYDEQGRMLPAGDPSYWSSASGSGSSSAIGNLDRGIETPNPVPVAKEAMNVTAFPNSVVDSVNKLVSDIQRVKPEQEMKTGFPGALGSTPSYYYKNSLTGEELTNKLEEHVPSVIKNSIDNLNQKMKTKQGILTSEDKRKAVKTLNSAGQYYQGMMAIFQDTEQDLKISNKVRNVIAKYYADKTVEVADLLESYSTKLPSWGNQGRHEVVQNPPRP